MRSCLSVTIQGKRNVDFFSPFFYNEDMDPSVVTSFLSGKAGDLSVQVEKVVTSTNDLLKQAAGQGAPDGTVIVAMQQTKGKGRLGRSFYSPADTGLYLSLLLRPHLPADQSLMLTIAAAVATARAVDRLTGEKTLIKWVNDLYLHGRKITGILTESSTGSSLDYAVVGIGVNVWEPEGGFPPEIASSAGALFAPGEHREKGTRGRLAAGILNEFMKIYPEMEPSSYLDDYRSRSFLIGQTVGYRAASHEPIAGSEKITVLGIGDHAQLIARTPDGKIREFSSGEISITDFQNT